MNMRMSKLKNSPAMMDVLHAVFCRLAQTNEDQAAVDFSTDTRLAWLTGRVGAIATTTRHRDAVQAVAAAAVAWLGAIHYCDMDIVRHIATERLRQRKLFADGKHRYRVDSPVVDWTRKLRVLVEELGELAEAVDQLEAAPSSGPARKHFIEELIQVAAVAVAWLESMEGK